MTLQIGIWAPVLLLIGIAVGAMLARALSRPQLDVHLRSRRRSSNGPPATDPATSAMVRSMLAERDAQVLRAAGHAVPAEPHGEPVRPRRAGLQLDEDLVEEDGHE
jgi:hypothetical protein